MLLAVAQPAFAEAGPDDGLSLELAYTGEVLAGQGARGAAYVDNLDLTVSAQAENTQIFAYALANNGTDFSGPRYPRGWVASNIETGTRALRLYEAWVDHTIADGKLSLRAGLYDLNSEFDALDAASLFVNPAHGIGTDFSQSGTSGPSIFPVTSLALRVQYRASETTTVRLAVLDAVPGDPAHPGRTAIKLGGGDGALLVGELDQALGKWRLIAGYWRYTAPFEDLLDSAVAGTGVMRRGAQGAYLRGEGLLSGQVAGKGLDAFFRLCWADGRFHEVERFASAGLRWREPIKGRSRDSAGIAMLWSGSSGRSREALALGGEDVARSDWGFEVTYALALADWLTAQPSVQYFIDPAYERGRNALMGGLRFTTSWSF
jgi:porin